jgi:(R,R)-butanediol dehydrogenase/meso-butanediol dehydrogenase/diacetyl reductase
MGANLYVEATGLPAVVYPGIEQAIWRGKTIGCTVVIVARADAKIPVTGEVLQVKKSRIVGAQGHSGYGTFPRVIECMAAGMDMTPLITKKVGLEAIAEQIVQLRTNRTDCKITYVADGF